jgi:PAS domain S-box-containing protein
VEQMHSLLKRQLRRCFGDPFYLPEEWQEFVGAVNAAYREFDVDREMLERSLELSSQELLQANSEMRVIFQAIPDLLFRLDSRGTILDYKASGTTHFFLRPQELVGKRIQDIPLKDVSDKFREAVQQALETRSITSIEYSLTMRDQAYSYEARLLPLLEDQIIVIIRDITERKRAELEREKLIAELEIKNAELERFTYTVSHDLKSPLITIQGFLGYLEQDAQAGNIEQMKSDMARIVNAAEKMEQLLSELLELSRIGRAMNPPEEVSLDELAREAVRLVEARLVKRGVKVEIVPDLPVVYGDRTRLREVLENLLDNAIKYMGGQPEPRIEIGERQDGADAERVFYVRDNGMGIEPRYHQKIFGLFEKLDPKSEGTGVGLAIVKRIVEAHGGRIWVESEGEGCGSTFCFTLPRGGATGLPASSAVH